MHNQPHNNVEVGGVNKDLINNYDNFNNLKGKRK